MRSVTHRGCVCVSELAVAIMLILSASTATSGQHPSLIDPETTNCSECHEDILEGAVRHTPAADGCLACHVFEKVNDGTSVSVAVSGPELCLTCHGELEPAVRGALDAPHAPVVDGCANCHDPHSSSEDYLLVVPPSTLCASCHDPTETDAVHPIPVSRADCNGCHNPHGSGEEHMLVGTYRHVPFSEGSCEACHRKPRGTRVRLKLEGDRLCYACHSDLEQRLTSGYVHTAVREGLCLSCHDPHLSGRPKLLKALDGDLCLRCHSKIEAKMAGEHSHAALEEGCGGCHDPHQSGHRGQLVEQPTTLCLSCHGQNDRELVDSHLGAELAQVDCSECHDAHGSTEPHLIAAGSLHPPFVEDCNSCHRGNADRLVAGGGAALCYACHHEIRQVVQESRVPHPAMESAECVDCHSPHASNQPGLIRSPGGEICTTCHEDQLPTAQQIPHGATEWLGCQSCHLPHGATLDHLLRVSGNDLCLGCHLEGEVSLDRSGEVVLPGGAVLSGTRAESLAVVDLDPSRTRDHPIPSHPVAGVVTSGGRGKLPESLIGTEMTCLSCHVPHAASSRQLLAYGASSQIELCAACHIK